MDPAAREDSSRGDPFGLLEQVPSMDGIRSTVPVHANHSDERSALLYRFNQHSTGWKRYAKFSAIRRVIDRWNWSRQPIPRHNASL